MSDALKEVYGGANRMDRFFEDRTPCDLYRGQKKGSKVGLMVPMIFGFYRRKEPRKPDIHIRNDQDVSPQFEQNGDLVTEGKSMSLTLDMLAKADQYMVRGCRTMAGDFRGLSVFNGANLKLPFDWYLISEDTEIPDGLAITRDAPPGKKGMVHYTVAPKDDMTLALYLQQLKALGDTATPVKE